MKPIRLSAHALSYTQKRGFTSKEVIDTIQTAPQKPAELPGRLQCYKDFYFSQIWNGKFYTIKQVRPIFVEEATEIVVVTVYTYYF